MKRLAGKLGVKHRTVRWTGKKPATGIQAAARDRALSRCSQAPPEGRVHATS